MAASSALPAAAAPSGPPAATVQTVAGPGFCAHRGAPSPQARQVRALAVDPEGRVFFDTGLPAAGALAQVDPDGRVQLRPIAVPSGPGSADGSGDLAALPTASRLAPDGRGGAFVAAGTRVVQLTPFGPGGGLERSDVSVLTAAGTAAAATGRAATVPSPVLSPSSGDGGPPLLARFASARSVATDAAANLFVADMDPGRGSFRVRVVNRGEAPLTFYPGTPGQVVVAPGTIETIVGAPASGAGPAAGPTPASGAAPTSDAEPGSGPPSGGASARTATLSGVPPALAVAPGRLYITATPASGPPSGRRARIWVVNLGGEPIAAHGRPVAPGAIEPVPDRSPGPAGQAGPAAGRPSRTPAGADRERGFAYVPGLATDAAGNLLVADPARHRVARIDPDGKVSTVAGGAGPGFNGNDRPAVGARLNRPFDVKAGPRGGIYIADQLNGQVRVVDAAGIIHAVPGAGVAAGMTCLTAPGKGTGRGEVPQPGRPIAIAADPAGNTYISLFEQSRVMRVDRSGAVATVAGPRPRSCGPPGCPETTARAGEAATGVLVRPGALAWRPGGGLYVLDEGGHRVWLVNLGRHEVTAHGVRVAPATLAVVAGNGAAGRAGDGGRARRAELVGAAGTAGGARSSAPAALAVDARGDLFVADPANDRVRMVDRAGIITTVAGAGGPGPASRCCHAPLAVAADPSGDLYVAGTEPARSGSQSFANQIWFLNRSATRAVAAMGRPVAPGSTLVVAGTGTFGDVDDGTPAVGAPLLVVRGIALDGRGSLYVAEGAVAALAPDVRRIDGADLMSTVMGNGGSGFNGDGLAPRLTSLSTPSGVAVDACGGLLVADSATDRVRRVGLDAACSPGPEATGTRTGARRVLRLFVVMFAAAAVAAAAVTRRRHRAANRQPTRPKLRANSTPGP